MKRQSTALFVCILLMLSVAGCMGNKNDNPVYSTQPADNIADLDYLENQTDSGMNHD